MALSKTLILSLLATATSAYPADSKRASPHGNTARQVNVVNAATVVALLESDLVKAQQVSSNLQAEILAVQQLLGQGAANNAGSVIVPAAPAAPPAAAPPATNSSNSANNAALPDGAAQAIAAVANIDLTKNGVQQSTDGPVTVTGGQILPDGRIAQTAVATDFNVLASVFKSAVVKGDGLKFSDVVSFPNVAASMFDKAGNTKAFEISINDSSIFVPQGGAAENATRRADLLPSIRSALNDSAVSGVKVLHFSVQADAAKPLNLTHDYQLVNLESADFSFHQFDVRTGGAAAGNITINGNSKTTPAPATIFTTPMAAGTFNNFALQLDFDKNTVQVFHSTGNDALTKVTDPVANDLTGKGEYHFALLKNAVNGEQPSGINEGIIYGGIFMEPNTATLQA